MILILTTPRPDPIDVAGAIDAAGESKLQVRFDYDCQLPTPDTPSYRRARADTRVLAPPERVQGFLQDKDGNPLECAYGREGHWYFTLRSQKRRKLQPTGLGYFAAYGMVQDEHLFRSYRVEGIRLGTLAVMIPRQGWVRLVPYA